MVWGGGVLLAEVSEGFELGCVEKCEHRFRLIQVLNSIRIKLHHIRLQLGLRRKKSLTIPNIKLPQHQKRNHIFCVSLREFQDFLFFVFEKFRDRVVLGVGTFAAQKNLKIQMRRASVLKSRYSQTHTLCEKMQFSIS